jgi:hypothetical protein
MIFFQFLLQPQRRDGELLAKDLHLFTTVTGRSGVNAGALDGTNEQVFSRVLHVDELHNSGFVSGAFQQTGSYRIRCQRREFIMQNTVARKQRQVIFR